MIRASIRQTIDDLAPGGSFIATGIYTNNPEFNQFVDQEIKSYGSTKYSCPRPEKTC